MSKSRSFLILLIIAFSIFNLTFQEPPNETDYPEDDDPENPFNKLDFKNVRTFEDVNYNEIADYDLIYLFFYSKTCEFSQFFIQEYVKAADYCAEKKMKVKFGKIDVESNPTVSGDYGVSSFPIVYLVNKGRKYLFEGIRTKESLLIFLERKLNDDILKIEKLSEINRYLNNSYLVFLSTLKDNTTTIFKSFHNYAKNISRFYFISCLSKECNTKYGEDIILFKDKGKIEYSYLKNYGKFDEAKINSVQHFASIFAVEPGEFLTPRSIDMLYIYEKKSLFYIRNSSIPQQKDFDKIFFELGKELRKKEIYVFTSDRGEELKTNIGDAFSLEPAELPAIAYYILNTGDKDSSIYLYKKINLDLKKFTKEDVKNYISDIEKGKIKRDLYSEPMSESKVVRYVQKIIGKTFDRDVVNSKKNFFLLVVDEDMTSEEKFFMRIMRNLTFRFENDPEKNISLGFLKAEYNEVRGINIKDGDYPKAFLFTNALEKKEVIEFVPRNMSQLSLEEVEQFLLKNLKWKDLSNKYQVNLEEDEETPEPEKKEESSQTDL